MILRTPLRLFALLLAGSCIGCATREISMHPVTSSDPLAVRIVEQAQDAHGLKNFTAVRDISVRYDGEWGSIGPRLQPVLSDRDFRGSSEERLHVSSDTIAQAFSGPEGKKFVLRTPTETSVAYNGKKSSDEEQIRASALVADAFRLYLLGPLFFHHRQGVFFERAGESTIDDVPCDRILAVLRPGLGMADEDRVLLSIDRVTNRLVAVRMTLKGLASTQGAEVEVYFRSFRKIGGILWATDYDEQIRVPVNLHAHHWNLHGLDVNRGFDATALESPAFTGLAVAPAAPIGAMEN